MIEKIKKLLKKEPNLKAREIAKKLKLGRSEVSALMHKNKKIFYQNSDYEWSYASGEVTVKFDGKWITCELFESSLSEAAAQLENVSEIQFTFPKNCKFLLESTARLLALCNQLNANKIGVTIDLTENAGSLHYLNRAGFFDQLDENVSVLPKRPKYSTAKAFKGNSKNIVEFGAVIPLEENKELVDQLTEAFVALSGEKYRDAAFTIFAELIGNIKEHSGSQIRGFAALQKYEGYAGRRPHIQTVVSDSGLGIVATLRPTLNAHYPDLKGLSDIDLTKAVMTKGEISKHGEGRGLGFKSSKEKALKFNAKYSIRQKEFGLDFQFVSGALKVKKHEGLANILGTHICFDFDID